MEQYEPARQLYYIVESDGDQWFAHYNTFTNIQESNEFAFGRTPQEALQKFMGSRVEATNITQ